VGRRARHQHGDAAIPEISLALSVAAIPLIRHVFVSDPDGGTGSGSDYIAIMLWRPLPVAPLVDLAFWAALMSLARGHDHRSPTTAAWVTFLYLSDAMVMTVATAVAPWEKWQRSDSR
jgi:hypothetical protein